MGKWKGPVISDAVNLASRLEGLNKVYGARLIISEATYAKISEPDKYLPRRLDRVRVKGKNQRSRYLRTYGSRARAHEVAKKQIQRQI